jgi:hypothetical protein
MKTYVTLLSTFWLIDREIPFSAAETRLYTYLVNSAYALGFKTGLTRADGLLAAELSMSRNTLLSAREKLIRGGLVTLDDGRQGRVKNVYHINTNVNVQVVVQKLNNKQNIKPITTNPKPKKNKVIEPVATIQPSLFPEVEVKQDENVKEKSHRFVKPTEEQVATYIQEKGYTFTASAFIDFYESKGWVVGKSPMKDWKAACRTWSRMERTPTVSRKSTILQDNSINKFENDSW